MNYSKNEPTLMSKTLLLVGAVFFVAIGLLGGYFFIPHDGGMAAFMEKDMGEKRLEFIAEKEVIMGEMLAHGDYACCLENPCTYCIEKTPGHGEDAACSCLEDVINGVHPCGECIGEILEGHGNVFLAPYFALAIAEKVGMNHLPTIQQIISEKYDVSLEEQL